MCSSLDDLKALLLSQFVKASDEDAVYRGYHLGLQADASVDDRKLDRRRLEEALDETVGHQTVISPNWRLVSNGEGGVVAAKYGIEFFVRHEDVLEAQELGYANCTALRVRAPRLMLGLSPGYAVLSGPFVEDREFSTRIYVNTHASVAVSRIDEILTVIDTLLKDYQLKILVDGDSRRTDSLVLFSNLMTRAAAVSVIDALCVALDGAIRPLTPLFTRRMRLGCAIAKNPPDGRSFGRHICSIVAPVASASAGISDESVVLDACARLRDKGIPPEAIWSLGDEKFALAFL